MVSFIRSFVKETCTFKEPTNRSHPILTLQVQLSVLSLLSGIWSLVYGSFAKETYNLKEPTNRSHPISALRCTPATVKRDITRKREHGLPELSTQHSAVSSIIIKIDFFTIIFILLPLKVSRLLKIIGLFCKRAIYKRPYS